MDRDTDESEDLRIYIDARRKKQIEPPEPDMDRSSGNGGESLSTVAIVSPGDTSGYTRDDQEGQEEELTRCICGQQEYPGVPSRHENGAGPTHKYPTDEGALFIQCDDCKVWQHGGCLGILDEFMSPVAYYCEQCREDFHDITVAANG